MQPKDAWCCCAKSYLIWVQMSSSAHARQYLRRQLSYSTGFSNALRNSNLALASKSLDPDGLLGVFFSTVKPEQLSG